MKMMNRYSFILLSSAVLLCGFVELGLSREDSFHKMKFGGVQTCKGSQNGAEMESLARFAVQEHNKKENSLLEFSRVLKAREQVVAGMMYHLTLEAVDAGKKKIYQAKVWVKPWMNFKKLEEFKHAKDGPSFTTSDLGVKHDGRDLEWHEVPTNDLEVQGAASYAVKSIQQSSNSLNPYELLEILHAKAKVIEDYARYELHLKLQWGVEEVKFQVEVIKNSDGKFHLKYFN